LKYFFYFILKVFLLKQHTLFKMQTSSNDIYIPRINDSHNENDVIKVFNNLHVGVVQHVDFVATKNLET